MGLDVSHVQLTLTSNDNHRFFYLDDWESGCNVPLKNYSKYITTIDDLDFNKVLAIIENEEEYEKTKKRDWFAAMDYLNVFIGELNHTMEEQIATFISSQKLDKLETSRLIFECDGLKYQTIAFGEPIKVQGVYYTDDIGYQRKGMSNAFYETFKEYMLWGNKEDFELAYTCVGDEWYLKNWGERAVSEMREDFKANFIDKFEFGKSLLVVSF